MAQMSGHCDKKFEGMRQVLSKSIDLGTDLGASVAITIDGKFVVDMWGGWVDEAKTIPWAENTLTNVWSTTKTMAALCALVLVERRQLDVDAPVSKYWPEFAANGKEGVLGTMRDSRKRCRVPTRVLVPRACGSTCPSRRCPR